MLANHFAIIIYLVACTLNTVEPPNKGHFGTALVDNVHDRRLSSLEGYKYIIINNLRKYFWASNSVLCREAYIIMLLCLGESTNRLF